MALVLPPIAMSAVMALSNASGLMMSLGLRSSQAISTMRCPQRAAIRECAECTAGMEAEPGRVKPRVSTREVMVDAVPIVMQ